jgi:hypothetical protein
MSARTAAIFSPSITTTAFVTSFAEWPVAAYIDECGAELEYIINTR